MAELTACPALRDCAAIWVLQSNCRGALVAYNKHVLSGMHTQVTSLELAVRPKLLALGLHWDKWFVGET